MSKIDCIKSILQEHNIDIAILFRPQELMMTLGYYPHLNSSFLVISKDSDNYLFVPDFECEVRALKNKDKFIEIRYALGTSCGNPFLSLLDLIINKTHAQSFTLNSDLIMPAASSNFGEGPLTPLSFFFNLMQRLNFINVNKELSSLHVQKDEIDLKGLNFAHKVAHKGVLEFFKAHVGQSALNLSANIERAILQEAENLGAKVCKAYALVQVGFETINSYRYNKTSTEIIEKDSIIFLELSCVVDGYWLDLTRIKVIEANDSQKLYFSYVKESLDSVLKACKSGVRASDLYDISKNVFKKYKVDLYYPHALGHATGYGYHDPGLLIKDNCKEILKTNTVMTVEPGIYDKALLGGFRIEENIVITDNGFTYLSKPQQSFDN